MRISDWSSDVCSSDLDFGIDARSSQAVVTYDAILLGDNGATMTKRRFSATRPVSPIEPARVGRALNDAANDVAAQVAVWVGSSNRRGRGRCDLRHTITGFCSPAR